MLNKYITIEKLVASVRYYTRLVKGRKLLCSFPQQIVKTAYYWAVRRFLSLECESAMSSHNWLNKVCPVLYDSYILGMWVQKKNERERRAPFWPSNYADILEKMFRKSIRCCLKIEQSALKIWFRKQACQWIPFIPSYRNNCQYLRCMLHRYRECWRQKWKIP